MSTLLLESQQIHSVAKKEITENSHTKLSPYSKVPKRLTMPSNDRQNAMDCLYLLNKYIAATYEEDVENFALFIKKNSKWSVASVVLVSTNVEGALGSFYLAVSIELDAGSATRSAGA